MNIIDLRGDLINLFEDLKSDSVDYKKAKEMNSAASKIMTSLKMQMEYAKLNDKKVKIEFLEP